MATTQDSVADRETTMYTTAANSPRQHPVTADEAQMQAIVQDA